MKNRLAITLGHYSSAGAKLENQDFHGALQPEGADLAAKGIVLCLADGISTSALGATAAETAVKTFLSDYYCTSPAWSVRTSAERVIAATNSWMHAQNRRVLGPVPSDSERERGLVCTFSALILKSRSAHVFHIGDAQVARISGQSVEPLTELHRVDLGGGESYLGRAMGVNRAVEIDYRQVPLVPGDLFMLSTDGVHEYLSARMIVDIIEAAATLDVAARIIAATAQAGGSGDNLTVQLVRIESLPDGGIEDLVGAETSLPPASVLAEGQGFEGYTILRQIHSGSRSHVYLACDDASGAEVALKILSTELAEDPAALSSLLLEEWILRRLDHPNLLRAATHYRARRFAFSVSQYVAGQSLHAWMLDHPMPDLATVREVVKQLASGLQALHRREMVHRDIRPHNVLLDRDGRAIIIDFGSVQVAGLDELAQRPLEAAFAGTIQYSAPELYLGYPATRQSDLYSLGVVAYQMLTGHLPYGPRVAAAGTRAAQRKLTYTPVMHYNPDVPDWMDAAIRKAVNLDPARRYGELSEFVVDLTKPNASLAPAGLMPLFQRGSVRAWKIVSGILAAALLASLLTRPDVAGPSPTPEQEIIP
ncbi:serine/threonine protein kinase [Croceicoccus estronivorus]|nr:serine/threonine protein kinase [Croceicoccus estronivorus]